MLLKRIVRFIPFRPSELFRIMMPPALLLSVCSRGLEAAEKTYQPTQAQRRLAEQQRLQNQRIAEIRRRNAERNAAKTAAAQAAEKRAKAAAAAAPKLRYTWIKSQRYVLIRDIARFYKLSMIRTKAGTVLRGAGKIDLFYNRRAASVNGVAICLTFAPLLRGTDGYLHEKDLLLVLDPLLRGGGLAKYPIRTIMIDPGHGGADKGAPGKSGLLEKNLNLSMAMKLRTALRKLGFQVIMTRAADSALSLQARADLCKKFRPDLFISIHCNAASQKTISGIETFAMTPAGCASSSDSRPSSVRGSGNAFDKNNYRLAYEIQKALLRNTKAEDRGVKHARFFVLRNASCPAVLVETGFISNQREGALLNRADYQAKIVNAIVLGILNYRRACR